jgi:hypothetical protein
MTDITVKVKANMGFAKIFSAAEVSERILLSGLLAAEHTHHFAEKIWKRTG